MIYQEMLKILRFRSLIMISRDRETERQRDRETKRQRDKETERQRQIIYDDNNGNDSMDNLLLFEITYFLTL